MAWMLFAEAAATTPDLNITNVLVAYGPLGVICGVFLYFLVKWGDKIAEGHVNLVRVCGETQERIASALNQISEATERWSDATVSQANECLKTQKIVSHMARGHAADATNSEAKWHFERAVEETAAPHS